MIESMLHTVLDSPWWIALLISLLASCLISIVGVIPSVAVTAFNLAVFGFWGGMLISFAGEVLGSAVSFWLYRLGLQRGTHKLAARYPKISPLLTVNGMQAFWLIISLRILPFMPSSIITLFAAVGTVSFPLFITASTIGKLPAILLETLATNQLLTWLPLQWIAVGIAVVVVSSLILSLSRKHGIQHESRL